MGGATRFLLLLTPSPLHLHRHRCPSLLRLSRRLSTPLSSPPQYHNSHSLSRPTSQPLHPTTNTNTNTKPSRQFYTQASSLPNYYPSPVPHSWPEFQSLLNSLSLYGYFNSTHGYYPDISATNLPDDFLQAVKACLSFAFDRPNLLRMLPRKDVEVVVEYGYGASSLFVNGYESWTRMKSFLADNRSNIEKANTVDLMRLLLSCVNNLSAPVDTNSVYHRELVESSVRNLLSEMAKLSNFNIMPESTNFGSVQSQFPDRYGQVPRTFGQQIEMRRGDWICPSCSFMNFAKNMKCLDCEEARPDRQLTGKEWECPQCGFYNFGKNVVCLRCDCKGPRNVSLSSDSGSSKESVNTFDVDSRLAANEEKAQRWFSKVSQLESTSEISSVKSDEDFPEIMPLRKGVNRFVVNTRKTPLERRLENAQYRRNLGNDDAPKRNDHHIGVTDKTLDSKVKRSLEDILVRSSTAAEPRQAVNSGETNSKYAPFVPLPADTFAQKPENGKRDETKQSAVDINQSVTSNTGEKIGTVSRSNDYDSSGDNLWAADKPLNCEVTDNKAKKSDRWYNRVAKVNDAPHLANDYEDFPETMPMRKGENRFVGSKTKDRSLTTPMYKRQMAMEQTSSTNHVPFVPFPPDYFAKKDKQPDATDSMAKANSEANVNSVMPVNSNYSRPQVSDPVSKFENQSSWSGDWNLDHRGENMTVGASTDNNSIQNLKPSTVSNGYSRTERTNFDGSSSQPAVNQSMSSSQPAVNQSMSSSQPAVNQSMSGSWTGKSLEGSAVKESDPLDMSEEAKAERWFRRVAQIKDISELSQIPDEDFPSIMPMRKGVNRFVVSKRKTPLERRLTSQQYRRNLPVVSSDAVKKEQKDSS